MKKICIFFSMIILILLVSCEFNNKDVETEINKSESSQKIVEENNSALKNSDLEKNKSTSETENDEEELISDENNFYTNYNNNGNSKNTENSKTEDMSSNEESVEFCYENERTELAVDDEKSEKGIDVEENENKYEDSKDISESDDSENFNNENNSELDENPEENEDTENYDSIEYLNGHEHKDIAEKYIASDKFVNNFIKYGLKTNDKSIEYQDRNYAEVDDDNISSIDDMKKYMSKTFSSDCVNNLINISIRNRYLEVNDKLYQIDGEQELIVRDDLPHIKDINIEKISEDKYEITVRKYLGQKSDELYDFTYTYEKISDEWIFTTYPIIKPFMLEKAIDMELPLTNTELMDIDDKIEVDRFFAEANRVYSILVYSRCIFMSNDKISLGGIPYFRVVYPIRNMESLRSYISIYFNEDMIDRLIGFHGYDVCIEIDGELYASEMDMFGGNISQSENIESALEKVSDTEYKYTLAFDKNIVGEEIDESNPIYQDYPLEKINDKWVFTDFPSTFWNR